MATKHYEWIPGDPPPVLGRHSIAKHKVLQAYLEKYVAILAGRPVQDQLKLTLVDGFAGGGVYLHPDTNERLPGSPLIMLQAMSAAEVAANEVRRKQFFLNVEYYFVEKLAPTIEYLRSELRASKEAHVQSERIQVLCGSFSEHLDAILTRVEKRGRSRRVIFVLDQYGFSDVQIADLRTIFKRLPNAEVILTIAIDWLIDHWTESVCYDQILANLGINLGAAYAASVKRENPLDWRPLIQHSLHRELFMNSGAEYYTPFFIHSVEAHRAYWLLHFSGHSKARDAMMQLHWELENHFQHFGQAGFFMLGYDPRRDCEKTGARKLSFGFDSFAAEETKYALLEQLPRRVAESKHGISFGRFFNSVVNETPATKDMLAQQISELSREKELEIRTADGRLRRNGVQIHDDDIIIRPQQRLLLPQHIR